MLCLVQQASLFSTQSHNQSCAICPLYRLPATCFTPVCCWQAEPVHIWKCPPDSHASFSISLGSMFDCTWTLAMWQPTQEFQSAFWPGWPLSCSHSLGGGVGLRCPLPLHNTRRAAAEDSTALLAPQWTCPDLVMSSRSLLRKFQLCLRLCPCLQRQARASKDGFVHEWPAGRSPWAVTV